MLSLLMGSSCNIITESQSSKNLETGIILQRNTFLKNQLINCADGLKNTRKYWENTRKMLERTVQWMLKFRKAALNK